LHKRLEDLKPEARISPLPPVVLGGLLVIPAGLLRALGGKSGQPAEAAAAPAPAAGIMAPVVDTQARRGRGRS
jgi:hypothetical protein